MNLSQTLTGRDIAALLQFYQQVGVDVALQTVPFDHFIEHVPEQPDPASAPVIQQDSASLHVPNKQRVPAKAVTSAPLITAASAIEQARAMAASAPSLDALREALNAYDACALKLTAKNTCFADGSPSSPLMLVGEAPGSDEDIQGLPFVGRSGQLLNNILAAIGLERAQVYIANIIPWRPPGNRAPSQTEIELCRPFIERQIELAQPKLLVALGGSATKFLTGETQAIVKLRGTWLAHKTVSGVEIPVMPTLHPAYLLRAPSHKKFVWQDFLRIKQHLQHLLAS